MYHLSDELKQKLLNGDLSTPFKAKKSGLYLTFDQIQLQQRGPTLEVVYWQGGRPVCMQSGEVDTRLAVPITIQVDGRIKIEVK